MDSKQILEILNTDRFHRFYLGAFTEFVRGDSDAQTEEEILERIKQLFNLEK